VKKLKLTLRLCATLVIPALVALLLLAPNRASAHEDRPVGDYNLHVGWHVEPALVGQINAVELIVTTTKDGKPVAGVEKTLSVTVSTGGKTSDALNFDASDETPGLYTATIIPTVPGDYKFHVVGTIDQTKVDETFDTAQGKIASVDPLSSYEFPVKDPSNAELQKEIDDLKAQIAALKGATPVATAAK
jgi:hypothetical protein